MNRIAHPREGGGPRTYWIPRATVATFIALTLAAASHAQEPSEAVFVLEHARAAHALELVVPLLSPNGSVELRQAGNALAVRDLPEVLERIRARLDSFDRPVVPLVVELQIFAGGTTAGRGPELVLDDEVAARLKELFRFDDYRLVAGGRVVTREGERVLYQAPGGFQVRFQAGHVESDGRLRLEAFVLEREGEEGGWSPLVSGRLHLVTGRPHVIALTRSEDADHALFLAITCRPTPMRASRAAQ